VSDIESKLSDPDWDRYRVAAPPSAPSGDPSRWGAQVITNVPGSKNTSSGQILSVSTRDDYARSWALIGTLSLPYYYWETTPVGIWLEVTMGVGQVQLTHRIVLLNHSGGSPAVGLKGLCHDQLWLNGGPYMRGINDGDNEVRAFAAIGALIGQSIAVRGEYQIGAGPAGVCRLQLMVTPFAAGQGI
jgi:hypothetical protein